LRGTDHRSLYGAAMSGVGQGKLWELLAGFPRLVNLVLTDNYISTALDFPTLATSCPLLQELYALRLPWVGEDTLPSARALRVKC
jgi:hypothetical protein